MALKWLRDNLRHLKFILWGVVIVFVLLVFVDWGAGRPGGPGGGGAAMTIGNRSISEAEFMVEMRRIDQQFSRIYGEQWNQIRDQIDLAGQTTQYFVDRELQLAEARDIGITVTPDELQEAILEIPSFQDANGAFVGTETYERIVTANFRMVPSEFEARLREDLMIGKLNTLAHRSVWVSDDEAESEFRRTRETADLDVIRLNYADYLTGVSISEEDARAAFAATADDYIREEQRVIRYLVVETDKLRRSLPVEDSELEAYYQEHQEDFLQGEQANARHILIRLTPDATPEKRTDAEALAGGVAAIARSGADFGEIAAKHSEDPGSKDNGGDLGWFGRGRMVAEFDNAVFSAKPGEIIGPVRSEFGFHIIKVEAFRPEHQQPLEEVIETVRSRVVEGRASAEAESRATALARRLQSERPDTVEAWEVIAAEDDAVAVNVSLPFSLGETIPGASEDGTLANEVFVGEVGDIVGPIPARRGYIVWQLAEIRPAGVPPFEDVRVAVEQALRQERALELAMVEGRELAEQWRQGSDGAELAEGAGSTLTDVPGHRRGAVIAGVGAVAAVDAGVFRAAAGEILDPVNAGDDGVFVVRVRELQLVETFELEGQLEGVRARLTAERANMFLRSILNERRRDTQVTIDNDIMQRFSPSRS